MNDVYAIGLMSGTSLDGLDVAYIRFYGSPIDYEIIQAYTFPYPCGLKTKLVSAGNLGGSELNRLHIELGRFFGERVKVFIDSFDIKQVDFVASHGHTVFHEPKDKITLQIGHPAYIAVQSEYSTIADFRSSDVFLGGQGAPLVPIGDKILFSNYTNRINLGGFANISFEKEGETLAFDICPFNIPFNFLSSKTGNTFDEGGKLAAKGKINQDLLEKLNGLEYYYSPLPKSLGREWYDLFFAPIVEQSPISDIDKLRTLSEHFAVQIAGSFIEGDVLVTGGGAYNKFLIDRVKSLTTNKIIIPDEKLINYKEALIFALLGLLRLNHKTNTLKSVTGAQKNHCGGAIYLP